MTGPSTYKTQGEWAKKVAELKTAVRIRELIIKADDLALEVATKIIAEQKGIVKTQKAMLEVRQNRILKLKKFMREESKSA